MLNTCGFLHILINRWSESNIMINTGNKLVKRQVTYDYLWRPAHPHHGDNRWSETKCFLETPVQKSTLLQCIIVHRFTEVLTDVTKLLLVARLLFIHKLTFYYGSVSQLGSHPGRGRHEAFTEQPQAMPELDSQVHYSIAIN